MGSSFDVIMAAYQSVERARKDFEALVTLVKDKAVRTEGVILVEHDADGGADHRAEDVDPPAGVAVADDVRSQGAGRVHRRAGDRACRRGSRWALPPRCSPGL